MVSFSTLLSLAEHLLKKSRLACYLANKCSIAAFRIDCFSDIDNGSDEASTKKSKKKKFKGEAADDQIEEDKPDKDASAKLATKKKTNLSKR
ncbi:nucleolar protein 56 isoform X2 [Iris pallida]|uniref:Nucleolar protein 56 isoform X2 n=1 Tax=Iris pallida TaxID=29817 RepID=A0AAX6GX80_IRIPA|nr:nucleolar protein 56 isoform X2 [Iris pallida]KAJ6833114.1 nucleolar protein 56 isoform X2 [Iris pallida]